VAANLLADVQDDDDRGGKVFWQTGNDFRNGFDAAGRRADDDDIPFRHFASTCKVRAKLRRRSSDVVV
jgi:hypothetical protein